MKVTLTVDDKLMSAAAEYAGLQTNADLLRLALKKYVEREAAKRLADMGGTQPDLKPIPRRRLAAKH
jgi:Arc/MetJ family transcription regulator